MKNKITAILAGAALMLGASSCVDLDQYPYDQTSEGTFWKTTAQYEQAVTQLYDLMPSAFDSSSDVNTDNAVHGIKWAAGAMAQGIYDPSSFSWKSDYRYIRIANQVITNAANSDLSGTDMDRILGQAYFWRAYLYFGLIQGYGDVPYYTEPLTLSDLSEVKRENWKTVYDYCMADLEKAISLLPATWAASDYGRVTKGAAYTLKAEMALYFANPECQHYVENGYQTAAQAAKAVMDLGQYELYDGAYSGDAKNYTGKYEQLFWEHEIENSREGILINKSVQGVNGNYYIGFMAFPTLGWGGTNPTKSLADAFEDVEGAPIEKSKLYNTKKPYENRDPRYEAIILHEGETMYGVTIHVAPLKSCAPQGIGTHGDATATGYYTQKWINPNIHPQSQGWDMGQSYPVYRYTQVLLTYAEAMNEMSDRPQEALDAVNKVRARVGMPALQKTDASKPTYVGSQDDLRQRIRNEWRIEFCFEGNRRYWDAKRWNIAMDVFNQPKKGVNYRLIENSPNADPADSGVECVMWEGDYIDVTPVLRYAPHNYLYPIPHDDIELYKELTQNPGY